MKIASLFCSIFGTLIFYQMATIGIELCDEGIRAAVADGEERGQLLALDEGTFASPSYIYHDEEGWIRGRAAERLFKRYPRKVSDAFWERLALKPSDLSDKPERPFFSELAYHHFRFIWERMGTLTSGAVDKVAVAVPGGYLQDNAESEEKVGLLLGMCADLKVPLVSVVDMAAAALRASRELEVFSGQEQEERLIYIDVHQHVALISCFRIDSNGLERESVHYFPRLGWAQVFDCVTEKVSNRFLQETAFDVAEDRRIEQELFDKVKSLLRQDEEGWGGASATITLESSGGVRQLTVPPDVLLQDAMPITEGLVSALQRTVKAQGLVLAEQGKVVLSDRAGRLPGLIELLKETGFTLSAILEAGTAARGAAGLALERSLPSHLEAVPLELRLPLRQRAPKQIEAESAGLTLRTIVPTHVVWQGVAYPIGSKGFLVGVPAQRDWGGIEIPEIEDVLAKQPLRFYWEAGILKLDEPKSASPVEILLNAQMLNSSVTLGVDSALTLRVGDVCVQLLLIACEGG